MLFLIMLLLSTALMKRKTYCMICKYPLIQSIYAWKRHLLRAVPQDRARQDVLDALDSSKVFIMQDFAMKFLPRCFKETQMEWFGKRGISWHISYCVRHTNLKECEISLYSHLFRQ